MKILDNIIIDFDFPGDFDEAIEREVEFLECFLSESSRLVFLQLESNLYPSPDSEITGLTEEIKEIVLKNTLLKTKEKLFDLNYEINEDEFFYWFSPKTKEEIIKIVKDDYFSYVCIVLEKGKDIKEYDYLLDIVENLKYEENNTCRALIINERIENSFKVNVKPKIENLFKCIVK